MSQVLDFTGKKVRQNGKCLDKFSVCHLIDEIKPSLHQVICMDCYTYSDCVKLLKSVLVDKNYKDIFGTQFIIQ